MCRHPVRDSSASRLHNDAAVSAPRTPVSTIASLLLRPFPRRSPTALATALVVGLLALPAAGPGAAVEQSPAAAATPSVEEARQALDQARALQQQTADRLDVLAGQFERARGHAERLGDELDGADDRVDQAREAVSDARTALGAQIRQAYKQPGLTLLRTSSAFLLAPDVETALHASAVMQRVAANRGQQLDGARRLGQQVVADVGTQRGIADGAAAALGDLEDLSATFTAALDTATGQVARAEAELAAAEEAAAQAAAAAAALAQTAGFSGLVQGVPSGPVKVATINGGTQEMTCPLGQPNGFIDSWGFPRSGGRRHQGVDMFATYGMPILATADGTIRRVFDNALGGLSIDLVDGLGNRYYYAHLSAAYVSAGQQVAVGQLIAANGNSGNARYTPPHLHWQFHPADGGPVNPFPLAAALCR